MKLKFETVETEREKLTNENEKLSKRVKFKAKELLENKILFYEKTILQIEWYQVLDISGRATKQMIYDLDFIKILINVLIVLKII